MRRHLGFSYNEWDELPWWVADHYWAEMVQEFFTLPDGSPSYSEPVFGSDAEAADARLRGFGAKIQNAEGVG